MKHLLFAILVTLGLQACAVYDDYEGPPNYAFGPPPTGAVYVSPGIYYQDIVVAGVVERRWYRWNGPSEGWRYYNGIHSGGAHHFDGGHGGHR